MLPKTIGKGHPVTLLSVSYEIMAKVVALCVRDVDKKIMHRKQMGFGQGCFILNTVIPEWEATEQEREIGQPALFLKIEFDKACNQIDWTFITDMLDLPGFGTQ